MKKWMMDLIEDEPLRDKLKSVIGKIKGGFEPGNEGDTLEGFLHFETVDKNLVNLIVKTDKVNEFSNMELFLLGASAYLHDLLKPSSAWGPLTHGGKVMKPITDKPELYGLDSRAEAIAIGWISAAHSSHSLDYTEWGRVPEKHGVDVNLRELAGIFLLADTLDTTTSRAPEMMRQIHYPEKFPDEKTEGKWLARQSITGWYIKEGKIVLQAYPMDVNEREAVLRAKTMMEEDLSEVKPMLKSLGFPCELELEMQDIFLKEKAVAEIHEATPFKGMGYYGESDAELFKGREEDERRVEEHIYTYPITVLAGSSGVGKTSLIHAGLFPKLKISGWECIYLRPVGDLSKIVESIKRMYGVEAGSLAEAFRKLDEKLKKKILVVIDQFEDVLSWHAEVFEDLVLDFCSIHGLRNPKLLVVLRSDALCDLNRKIFKEVMINGFPTVELGSLSRKGAQEALNTGFKAGKMTLHPPELIDEIINDLIEISPFDEVYPPHLQMVGEELCKHVDEKHKLVLKNAYYELRRAREIVTTYLFRKLDEFGEDKEHAITILKSLVSYAGRKAQKGVSEIEAETGIPKRELAELLKRLMNERMVRKLDGAVYEIIHDHFGELVNKEFVGEKERHIKFLKEQLNAAIAAFERNKALMHCQILAELYRYRKEIPVGESAYKVLLATWCARKVPSWYWLRNAENRKIIEIATELCEHTIEEIKKSASDLLADALIKEENREAARRLLIHEERYVREAAVNAIAKLVRREDLPIVREMLKDDNWRVREAAVNPFAKLVRREDLPIVREMLKDDDSIVREAAANAFRKLVRREDMPTVRELLENNDEFGVRIAAINAFTKLGSGEDLPIIRELLKDDKWEVRKAAINAFTTLGSGEDLPIVREMLKDNDWRVLEAAANAFTTLGSGEGLPIVRELLKDNDWRVREAAVDAFTTLGSREDLPILRELLKDNDGEVREAAVDAFTTLGSREDLPILRELLKDDKWEVRRAAVNAFTTLGSGEDLPTVRELLKDNDWRARGAAIKAFTKLGSREDLPIVRELLKDNDWRVREAAVDAFTKLGSREDLPIVRELLKDNDGEVREAAANAFTTLVRREDLPIVRELLKDDKWEVRRAAVNAFTTLGSGEDLPIVREMLKDDKWEVRKAAVNAFTTLGSGEDLPIVREMLKDNDWRVLEAAANAFAKLESGEDLPIVREMLKDDMWEVREAAVNAFTKLGSREDLPIVRELLKDDDSIVREAAINAFTKLGGREDLPIVRELLKDNDGGVREAAANAFTTLVRREDLPIVREMLKDNDGGVREAAANAFTTLVRREDLPIVREMLKDNDWRVREAAVNAFTKLGSREDLPIVRELLKDDMWEVRKAAANAFTTLGSGEDLPIVREMLKDDKWEVRKAAVNALTTLGSGEDLPIVRGLLKDDKWEVRKAAANAFAELGSEDGLDMLAEICVGTCATEKEPIEALERLDWKLYSPYALVENQG